MMELGANCCLALTLPTLWTECGLEGRVWVREGGLYSQGEVNGEVGALSASWSEGRIWGGGSLLITGRPQEDEHGVLQGPAFKEE